MGSDFIDTSYACQNEAATSLAVMYREPVRLIQKADVIPAGGEPVMHGVKLLLSLPGTKSPIAATIKHPNASLIDNVPKNLMAVIRS